MPKRNITSRQVRIIKGKPYAEPPRTVTLDGPVNHPTFQDYVRKNPEILEQDRDEYFGPDQPEERGYPWK